MRRVLRITISIISLATLCAAQKDKEKASAGVDSGSFGIYTGGRRIATETFSITQDASGTSTTSSELKEEGSAAPSQRCEMKVTSGGALIRYEWHELSPGKGELTVLPNNEFLIERVIENPGEKPKEQPFLLPNTSVVLDDNFFIQRELLAWRYLASSCVVAGSQMKCSAAQFGTLIPQGRVSTRLTVQPVGDEKLAIHGTERQLLRLTIKGEDGDWDLWLDPQDRYKLTRLVKAGVNTEIVRD
jgi:hypothetical protein